MNEANMSARSGAAGRVGQVSRVTGESDVRVAVNLDGTGEAAIATGVPFFDHMLHAFAKHSLIDLDVQARGDTEVDAHHTVEDTAICLGRAIDQALGDRRGITRFGDATVPLDEALAQAVVDISGRGLVVHTGESEAQAYHLIGGHFTGALTGHVFQALGTGARLTLHVRLLAGRDPHHIVEAQFKAVARALRAAVALDPRVAGVPSTKGAL
jgi:imidazoleglycerol-phosphate dehydratase